MSDPSARILLVDDDQGIQKVFAKRLKTAGYEVLQALDGEQALEQARTHSPDLIILDLMLPKLNGYEVCAHLKQNPATRHIPVVMFTAKGEPQDHVAGLMFGADAYISKSCSGNVLLDQVTATLSRGAG
jgi:DNA-binding response OmpR family regulator